MNLRFIAAASLLFASAAAAGCTDSADVATADGPDDSLSEHALSSAEHTAYNYFVSKGLTPAQAAGIVGNLIQESSVSPTVSEFGGGPGRGIAQWSTGGRWDSSTHDNVTWYANQHGVSRWALGTQLDFIWYELTTFSGYGLSSLKSSSTVSSATVAFMKYYEVCGACAQTARISDAQSVYNAYAGSSGGGTTSTPTGTGAACYSGTKNAEMPENSCLQSKFDNQWYQCSAGSWVDRWSDPDPCSGVFPL